MSKTSPKPRAGQGAKPPIKQAVKQGNNQNVRNGPPGKPQPSGRAGAGRPTPPRRPNPAVWKARRPRRNRTFWIAITLVVVIGVAAVIAVAGSGSSTSGGASQAASPALVRALTSVPSDVFSTVGKGSTVSLPTPIDAPALTTDGKPRIVYIGSEYCPYCAAERWGLALALTRFGTFTGLKTTHSSSTDVYPDTNTLSFHGATYQSQYVAFDSVELETNQPSGSGYTKLQTPTAEQAQLMSTYDAPPYVATASTGAIPFIDLGGKYVATGASYSVQLLAGKSHQQIADALSNPNSPIARGVVGAANTFTAAICNLTGNQPAGVCTDPAIQKLAAQLKG